MGTFSRSLELTKQSWSVLKAHPQLALFPLISSIVSAIVIASFAIPGFFLFAGTHSSGGVASSQYSFEAHGNNFGAAHYAFLFAFYFVTYFVVIFFNTGLVFCAGEVFNGRPATFADGLRLATSRLGSILFYALIASTVGMILRMVSERAGVVGRIITSLLGMAWTLLTYFVVPIMAVENKNPIQAIKDSGAMLKRTWGENIVVNTSLHLVFGLILMVALIPLFAGIFLAATGALIIGISMVVAAILFFVIVCLVSSTLTGVFQTALYIYARTGQLPSVYDPNVVQYAFRQQRQRGYNSFIS